MNDLYLHRPRTRSSHPWTILPWEGTYQLEIACINQILKGPSTMRKMYARDAHSLSPKKHCRLLFVLKCCLKEIAKDGTCEPAFLNGSSPPSQDTTWTSAAESNNSYRSHFDCAKRRPSLNKRAKTLPMRILKRPKMIPRLFHSRKQETTWLAFTQTTHELSIVEASNQMHSGSKKYAAHCNLLQFLSSMGRSGLDVSSGWLRSSTCLASEGGKTATHCI